MVLVECVSYTDGDWGVDVECRRCCGDLEGEARDVSGRGGGGGSWWMGMGMGTAEGTAALDTLNDNPSDCSNFFAYSTTTASKV